MRKRNKYELHRGSGYWILKVNDAVLIGAQSLCVSSLHARTQSSVHHKICIYEIFMTLFTLEQSFHLYNMYLPSWYMSGTDGIHQGFFYLPTTCPRLYTSG